MAAAHLVIEPHGRIAVLPLRRNVSRILLIKRIREIAHAAFTRHGAADVGEQLRHDRIGRRQLAVARGKLEQVHRRDTAAGGAVPEHALHRIRVELLAVARQIGRLPQFLVVDEEERAIAAVEAWQPDRAADVEAGLVLQQLGLRQPVTLVEIRVRVQRVAAVLVERRPEELVGPRPRRIPNLRRAAAERFGAAGGRDDGDLLDRVDARPDDGKEAVGALQRVVLDVHAVERHVDRALRHAVDARIARRVRRDTPGRNAMNCEASRLASGMFCT